MTWKHNDSNLWEAAKAVVGRQFIAAQAHPKKQERQQASNLTLHLQQLQREQKKPKVSRRKTT